MSKKSTFTQGDITKLLRGAKAAGIMVARITIDPSGSIIADFSSDNYRAEEPNEWDVVFDQQSRGRK